MTITNTLADLLNFLPTVILAVFIYMTALYTISLVRKRADIVDIGWGMGFILIALISLFNQDMLTDRMIIVTLLVLIWGIRLSLHIFLRNRGKEEDYRYLNFKKNWGNLFYIRSYFQIFLFQGFLMLIVSLPITLVSVSFSPNLVTLDYIGIGVWLIGFLIETLADIQLKQFINLKKAKIVTNKFANIGLWKYSRHPNYFGEILQWWGIGIIAYSVAYGYIGLLGPLAITYLIIFVSGIPLLEKRFKEHPEWEEYILRTNKLLPLPKLENLLPFKEK